MNTTTVNPIFKLLNFKETDLPYTVIMHNKLEAQMENEKLMEETVEHWEDIIDEIKHLPILNTKNPLCTKYFHTVRCSDNCPIKKDTGVDFCGGTSWSVVDKARRNLVDAAEDFRNYLNKL